MASHNTRASSIPSEPAGVVPSAGVTVWRVLEAIFNLFALNAVLLVLSLTVIGAPLAMRASVVALDRWRREGDDSLVRSFISCLRSGPLASPWLMVAVPMATSLLGAVEVRFFYRRLDVMAGICTGLGVIEVAVSLAVVGYVLVFSARDDRLSTVEGWRRALRSAGGHPVRVTVPVVAVLAVASYLLMADPSLTVIGLPLGALCASRHLVDRTSRPGLGLAPNLAVPESTAKEVSAR